MLVSSKCMNNIPYAAISDRVYVQHLLHPLQWFRNHQLWIFSYYLDKEKFISSTQLSKQFQKCFNVTKFQSKLDTTNNFIHRLFGCVIHVYSKKRRKADGHTSHGKGNACPSLQLSDNTIAIDYLGDGRDRGDTTFSLQITTYH